MKAQIHLIYISLLLLLLGGGLYLFQIHLNDSSQNESLSKQEHHPLKPGELTPPVNETSAEKESPTFSRESILERIDNLASIKNISERSEEAAAIIRELCEANLHDDAWSLIDRNSGSVRKRQIAAFFRYSKIDSGALVERMDELLYKGEISSALTARFAGLNLIEMDSFINDSSLLNFLTAKDDLEPDALQRALYSNLQMQVRFAKSQDAVDYSVELYEEGILDQKQLVSIISSDPNSDPWKRWELVARYASGSTNPISIRGSLRSLTIAEMVMRDPLKTIETLTVEADEQAAWDVAQAIGTWVEVDSHSASKWCEAHFESLNPMQQDYIAEHLANLALSKSEVDVARSWAGTIRSEDKRADLLQRLEEAERSAMEQEE